jgi:hypothetical protein
VDRVDLAPDTAQEQALTKKVVILRVQAAKNFVTR